jgi:hypothetical protein
MEAAVTAVAVPDLVPDGCGLGSGRGAPRRQRREPVREAVGQEGGRAVEGLGGQVAGQGLAYGGGGEVALQPGGDTGSEVFGVGGGEQ